MRPHICTYFITTQMHEGFVYLLKALLHLRTIHRSGKRRSPKKPFLLQQLRHREGGSRREGEGCFMSLFLLFPGREEQPPKQAPQPFAAATDRRRHTERRSRKKRGGGEAFCSLTFYPIFFLPVTPSGRRRLEVEGGREAVRGGGGSLFVLLFSSSSSDAAAIVPRAFHRRRRRA